MLNADYASAARSILDDFDLVFGRHPEIEFLELPKYSVWPQKLLGLEELRHRIKNRNEIIREFDAEKWGGLLSKYSSHSFGSTSAIRDFFDGDEEIPCFWKRRFYLIPAKDYSKVQADLLSEIISLFLPAENIVELGAGFGAMIHDIAQRERFKGIGFWGGELTESGKTLIQNISNDFNVPVRAFHFDFCADDFALQSNLPPNSILFTCFAISYAHDIGVQFIEKVISLKPKIIINLEPFYPWQSFDIFSLMVQKYYVANDYNRNIEGLIDAARELKIIDSLIKTEPLIGNNPFIPLSLLVWRPKT